MKKIALLFTLLILIALTACSKQKSNKQFNTYVESETEPSASKVSSETLYNQFLIGKISAVDKDGNSISIRSFQELATENYPGKYAIYDMNGDTIPELLFRTVRGLSIFWTVNGQVSLWYEGSTYETPLNEGTLLYQRNGGAPDHIDYQYFILKYNGDLLYSVSFSEYSEYIYKGQNQPAEYYINGLLVEEEFYQEFKKPFLLKSDNLIPWQSLQPVRF